MARFNFDRLPAQGSAFLLLEKPGLYMHVASTQIFDLGPLENEHGGVDFERIKRFIDSVLYRIPRYRQKLRWVPFESTPVWVDDPEFELDYHVRHSGLPKPGSDGQLKNLAARIMAQHLDRERPLWEIWVVEGLEGGRFALISKIHHCMIDGTSGLDISQILQSPKPDHEIKEPPLFIPRRQPGMVELWRDSIARRLGTPIRAIRGFDHFRRETENVLGELGVRARVLRDTLIARNLPASKTPINGRISPHRVFDWWVLPLADVKAVRRTLECTVNDVVLTVVTGAIREYMIRRLVDPEGLDFRVQAPVSVRPEEARGGFGNRVSALLLRLPLEAADMREQLAKIRDTTRHLKASQHALGVDMMTSLMEMMPTGLLSLGAQAASGNMNSIVTNVPGPQFPLYLLGAEMRALFPQVPLFQNVGLSIALISYNGRVCWGFNADPQLIPDLDAFVQLVRQSFEKMAEAVEVKLSPPEAFPL